MNKKLVSITLGAVAVITLISCGAKLKNKKVIQSAKAATKNVQNEPVSEQSPESESKPKPKPKPESTFSSVHIIGDSQVARHIGKAAQDVMHNKNVTYFGKPGYTVEKYLNDRQALNDALNFDAQVLYIQLGDNGVSNNADKTRELIRIIRNRHPNILIVWGGPMKAVVPSVESSYVTTQDKSSSRYIHTYNETRKLWSDRLKNALADVPGVLYIDNYSLQELQPNTSAFNDNRKGDGVHLTLDSATALMHIVNDVIDNQATT